MKRNKKNLISRRFFYGYKHLMWYQIIVETTWNWSIKIKKAMLSVILFMQQIETYIISPTWNQDETDVISHPQVESKPRWIQMQPGGLNLQSS